MIVIEDTEGMTREYPSVYRAEAGFAKDILASPVLLRPYRIYRYEEGTPDGDVEEEYDFEIEVRVLIRRRRGRTRPA